MLGLSNAKKRNKRFHEVAIRSAVRDEDPFCHRRSASMVGINGSGKARAVPVEAESVRRLAGVVNVDDQKLGARTGMKNWMPTSGARREALEAKQKAPRGRLPA
jgi:hypothetical protein